METIKLIINKNYVVVDYKDNSLVAFAYSAAEAASICATNKDYVCYKIGKYITCKLDD